MDCPVVSDHQHFAVVVQGETDDAQLGIGDLLVPGDLLAIVAFSAQILPVIQSPYR